MNNNNIFNPMSHSVISSFQYAAQELPYYKKILAERGIQPEAVTDESSFLALAPILTKDDLFGRFSATDFSPGGSIPDFASAIVSSGTSGVFSFGLISQDEVARQRAMVDGMMEQFFDAKNNPPLIINLLAMGVSFVSSYPVVPTSVRTDIALQVIKNFGQSKNVVLIGDPHVLKKLLEEGIASGIHWVEYSVSVIVGGVWFSASYVSYMLNLLNGSQSPEQQKNRLYSTMGVTEVGLNIFAATPDLVYMREVIQSSDELRSILAPKQLAVPIIMYQLAQDLHLEVVNQDEQGVGDLVVTHLNPAVTPCLIRYSTGDRVRLISVEEMDQMGIRPLMPLPVYAVYGRSSVTATTVTEADVKQALYADTDLCSIATGHFVIESESAGGVSVIVQLKKGVAVVPAKEVSGIIFRPVHYHDFHRDLEVSYEVKWKHH